MKSILGFILGFLLVTPAWGVDYYISPSGNDGNTCEQSKNIATPKRTLNNFIANCADVNGGDFGAGDTLYFRGGTYTETWNANTVHFPSGTGLVAGSTAVRYMAYPGEFPLIRRSSVDNFPMVNWAAVPSAGTFQNVIVDGGAHRGFIFDGTNNDDESVISVSTPNLIWQNTEIRNAPGCGSGIIGGWPSTNMTFRNNWIHHNGRGTDMSAPSCAGVNSGGYGAYFNAGDSVWEYNLIEHNGGYGLHVHRNSGTGPNIIVRYNTVRFNSATATQTTAGLIINGSSGHQAYNNIIYRNRAGLQVGRGCVSCAIYNNTVYDHTLYGLWIDAENVIGRNNAIHTSGSEHIHIESAFDASMTGSNNLCFGSGSTSNCNITGQDPLFKNASTGDFSLLSGSPAIDGGTNVGLPCNAGCAIGAFDPPVLIAAEVGTFGATKIRLTFTNNAAPPLQATGFALGWSSLRSDVPNSIVSALLIGTSTIELTVQTSFAAGDTCFIAYTTGTGTLTDSALIGNTANQPFLSRTNVPCTNNVTPTVGLVLAQSAYKIRELYGSETAAGWKAAENTAYQVIPGGAFRVRLKAKATGGNPAGFSVALQRQIDGGTWAAVPSTCTASQLICMFGTSPSIGVAHNTDTTEQLTSEHSNVACKIILTTAWPFVNLGQDTEMECEAAVKLWPTVTPGTSIKLRLAKDDGTAFDDYPIDKVATMAVSDHQFIAGDF